MGAFLPPLSAPPPLPPPPPSIRPQVAALYRGMGANLLRVVPATAATFVVYERVVAVLDEGGAMNTKR